MPWEKQFDRAAVLENAEATFWKNGYENTSMESLLAAMGIRKGSFYATFHSKHDVLMESLDLYNRQRVASFRKLQEESSPLTALRRHLDVVLEESLGGERLLGCFLVNSALELAPRDPAVRKVAANALGVHAAFLQELLDAAQRRGDLPPDYDSTGRATALLGVVLAMRVMARSGVPASTIQAVRQQAETLLDAAGT